MKILHVYKTSIPDSHGGVESFIDTLCKSTSALGVENTVLAMSKTPSKEPIELEGYMVHQAKQDLFLASTAFSLSAFSKFRKLARDADIIHYHFPYPFADMLHLLCGIKKPSLVTYHSDIIKQKTLIQIYRPLKRWFLGSVDHIVATSPNYLRTSDVLQKYSNKVSMVPIGIDVQNYPKAKKQRLDYWREKLKQPFFLFIGAMRYYKGLHIALDAIEGTDIQLVIAGSNGIEDELKAQAASLKLDNVSFLGSISEEDKVALLELCYGYVFPSHLRSEAFGISLLEAAVFKKPLISCEIGTGTTYININKKTGLVINPSSSGELKDAMRYLLANPDDAMKMGQNARSRTENLFTADKQADSYYELYEQLIAENVT